jgi:hypothetical protein
LDAPALLVPGAQLFILPDIQARGVGQALMSRTLDEAASNGAENRALITLGYNWPQLASISATASIRASRSTGWSRRQRRLMADNALIPTTGRSRSPLARGAGLARRGRGGGDRLSARHATRFRQATPGVRTLRADRAGRPAGYIYISAEGHIGPLLAAPGADEAAVALVGVCAALEGQPKLVSLIVPGRADRILAALSPLGSRNRC